MRACEVLLRAVVISKRQASEKLYQLCSAVRTGCIKTAESRATGVSCCKSSSSCMAV